MQVVRLLRLARAFPLRERRELVLSRAVRLRTGFLRFGRQMRARRLHHGRIAVSLAAASAAPSNLSTPAQTAGGSAVWVAGAAVLTMGVAIFRSKVKPHEESKADAEYTAMS